MSVDGRSTMQSPDFTAKTPTADAKRAIRDFLEEVRVHVERPRRGAKSIRWRPWRLQLGVLAVNLFTMSGCQDALDQRLAIIDAPRVLAIVSEPAEVKPGGHVTYSSLVATLGGPAADSADWGLCVAPKAPTEDNSVSSDCTGNDSLVELGDGPTAAAIVPSDACTLFGPDVPPGGFRPRDPDATGGFYQPVRAVTLDELAFGFTRITCKLGTAPSDVAHDYDLHYVANANPTVSLAIDPQEPTAGEAVTITASWPASAAESYLYYDPQSQTLVTRRESMRMSWFATGGELPVDATAVGETDDATSVSTTWRAPAQSSAWLWIVLRDSRGGIATQTLEVTLR
jgi:hypothetical protein